MNRDMKLCPRFENKFRDCPECKKQVKGTGRVKWYEHTEIWSVEYHCPHCEEFFLIYSPDNEEEITQHQTELNSQ